MTKATQELLEAADAIHELVVTAAYKGRINKGAAPFDLAARLRAAVDPLGPISQYEEAAAACRLELAEHRLLLPDRIDQGTRVYYPQRYDALGDFLDGFCAVAIIAALWWLL